ncbi:MAG: protein kinase [Geopsychrobacter sp.]|nr:protein kinase [Geopsychrobacter sp.]
MLKLDRQFGLYVIREPLALERAKASCRAEDPFFDRDVVLKLLGPEEVGGLENLQRLVPFLDSVAGLEHPAISPFYDTGIEGDSCYYTSPFYSGGSLADQLTKPTGVGRGMRIILQLCSGLAYADKEGFEHGKLSLKDIFFTEDDHAVITDFGVSTATKKLKHNDAPCEPSHANLLMTETLHSIGEILIKLLLGTGAKPDAVSTALIKQSHSAPIASLAADLLGESGHEISDFDELIERLTDLTALSSEAGINEYVEYVEQSNSSLDVHISGLKPAITPSQRQLEIKEAIYAKGEIRRLVAEKSKLQETLRRATAYKNYAEKKLASGAAALLVARQSEEKALREVKNAFEQTLDRGNSHLHPAFWLAGGILVGSLLTSGYTYFNQTPHQEQLQVQTAPTPPLLVKTKPPKQEAAIKVIAQTTPTVATVQTVDSSPLEDQALWWPAGGEFDPTAAVPLMPPIQAEASPQVSPLLKQVTLSSVATPDNAAEPQTDNLAQPAAERWWSVGDEFNPAPPRSDQQVNLDQDCQKALCVIEDWAQAWSSKDFERYFSYYSEKYRPEPGYSQEEWRSMRLARITRPQWIKVMLEDFNIRSFGEDHIQVKLKQSYSSNYYQDQILKSLNLIKEDGKWRIVTERSLGTVNDMVGG